MNNLSSLLRSDECFLIVFTSSFPSFYTTNVPVGLEELQSDNLAENKKTQRVKRDKVGERLGNFTDTSSFTAVSLCLISAVLTVVNSLF